MNEIKQRVAFNPILFRPVILAIGPVGCQIAGLNDVDPEAGEGVISDHSRCVWDRKGHRITISLINGGGFSASRSKEPDEEYRKG